VFLDPDFLRDAKISAIRVLGEQNKGRGDAIFTPNELAFTFEGSYVGANFGENRSRNSTVRVLADGHADRLTDTLTDANWFYSLSHDICYSYGTDKYRCECVLGDVTFTEFVRYVINEWATGKVMNEHWRPQYLLCSPCNIEYDFVGRFEHVNEDVKYVLAKLTASGGPGSNVTFPLSNSLGDVHFSQMFKSFYADVSRDVVRKLIRIYKRDYDLFGYDYHWVWTAVIVVHGPRPENSLLVPLEVANSTYDFCNFPCAWDIFWCEISLRIGSLVVQVGYKLDAFFPYVIHPVPSFNKMLSILFQIWYDSYRAEYDASAD